jgi:preprotein translocase subunit YajC
LTLASTCDYRWAFGIMEYDSKKRSFLTAACLILAFFVMRIVFLQEPWNSDDIRYFEMAEHLNAGEHVIQQAGLPGQVFHADLRFGLLLPLWLAIRICGHHIVAYYLLPIFFSFAGFLLTWKISAEVLPRVIVIGIAILHIVYPFETRHSSVLITDLPAAFFTLLYIYYIYKNPVNERNARKVLRCSFVGSLFVLWPYLMRDNQPVLLLPALAVLFTYRPYRWTVAGSLLFFCGWVLLEQWFYVAKGAPIGFRWQMLVAGQQGFMQFYPKYTPSQYLIRGFRFIAIDIGWVGLVFFVCAIGSHIYGYFISKNALVRACLAAGLATYVIFTFYIYGSANGRLIVMTSQHRFVQLFYYTSLLAIGVSLCHLAPRLRGMVGNVNVFHAVAAALFAVTLLCFGHAAYAHPSRLLSAESDLWATLGALDAEMDPEARAPITLTGTQHSLRVMKLLPRTMRGHSLAYRIVSHEELLNGLVSGPVEWFLIDRKREERDLIYLEGDERRQREHVLKEIGRHAENDYRSAFRGKSLNLYRRNQARPPP